jgi:putative membrane protein
MIKRFTDHSANERTYLAWIRTAIAIIALGFLIEKFNLFLNYFGKAVGDTAHFHSSSSAKFVGFVLLILAVVIIIASTIRFLLYRKSIESEDTETYGTIAPDIILGLLLVFLGIFLMIYLGHQVVI